MTAIDDELQKIAAELRASPSPDRYTQLYAAQQALGWAVSPEGFAPPYETVMSGKVLPPSRRIQEGSEGCSETLRQARS